MKTRALINIALVVLTAVYPVGIYFGLQYIEPRYLVLALLALFLLRFFLASPAASGNRLQGIGQQLFIPALMLVFAMVVFVSNQTTGLLLYPVIVSAGMLAVFAYTLVFPPSMIERLARMTNPELPAAAIAYTRKVTMVWCLFFIFNGSAAMLTTLYGDMEVWTLYNGLISYLLMGCLFAVEYLVRLRVQKQAH